MVVTTIAAVLATTPAVAQPADPPSDASVEMQRYQELGAEAAAAEEDLSEAQAELQTRQRQQETTEAALTRAIQTAEATQNSEQEFRAEVDTFVAAAFHGASTNQLSAVLTSDSPQDMLDQVSALNNLASDKIQALEHLRIAREQAAAAHDAAAEAQRQARTATEAAQDAVFTVRQRQGQLEQQIAGVRQALDALSAAERTRLNTVKDTGSYAGPTGAANNALQAALSRRGSEYEWGATGPDEFDCSGLTSWAYRQAGVSIPRTSRRQYTIGKPVGINELAPGDLLFFDDGSGNPGAIHHVGMFVGNGKMVDAPTEGQLVDVRSMRGDGHFIGARRIVG